MLRSQHKNVNNINTQDNMLPEEINTQSSVMFCDKSNSSNTQNKDFKTIVDMF